MKKLVNGFLSIAVLGALVSCASHKTDIAPAVVSTDEVSEREPAASCDKSKYKECKEARPSDSAKLYMLSHNGTLSRKINGVVCAVAENVIDFKISQHRDDVAVVYYKQGKADSRDKSGDLYLLNKDREVRSRGECPSTKGNKQKLMSNVEKFTVTANEHTAIVNAALDTKGNFTAWGNSKILYTDKKVESFQMNECFGVKNKSFSSYVLFTQDRAGHVTKVNKTYKKTIKKETDKKYRDIRDFIEDENVCSKQ